MINKRKEPGNLSRIRAYCARIVLDAENHVFSFRQTNWLLKLLSNLLPRRCAGPLPKGKHTDKLCFESVRDVDTASQNIEVLLFLFIFTEGALVERRRDAADAQPIVIGNM